MRRGDRRLAAVPLAAMAALAVLTAPGAPPAAATVGPDTDSVSSGAALPGTAPSGTTLSGAVPSDTAAGAVPVAPRTAAAATCRAATVRPTPSTTVRTASTTVGGRAVCYHVVTAHMGSDGLRGALLADSVTTKRRLSDWAGRAHGRGGERLVAAVNGDFYDIRGSQAPRGPLVRDGVAWKASDSSVPVVGVDTDSRLRRGTLRRTGTVTLDGQALPVGAVNSPAAADDRLRVFTPVWGPGRRAAASLSESAAAECREVVVDEGTVTEAGEGIGDTAVPRSGFVVVGCGGAAERLAGFGAGDAARLAYDDSGGPWAFALGHGGTLLTGGTVPTFPDRSHYQSRHPRTAIGHGADARRIILLVVDGRQAHSAGLSYADTARLIARLGATDAVMLDGGGSSELVAARSATARPSVISHPSDGTERAVPHAIALLSDR
ncbi:phosphodiester glycosidase family protein [Streptomyces sp. URMC 123]|uniref:phosphodiester glycosidase family protein n=1 Tax=Streptomyces sp. URMC 123 TaxID=3423403 RepID=UPI003F1A4FFB